MIYAANNGLHLTFGSSQKLIVVIVTVYHLHSNTLLTNLYLSQCTHYQNNILEIKQCNSQLHSVECDDGKRKLPFYQFKYEYVFMHANYNAAISLVERDQRACINISFALLICPCANQRDPRMPFSYYYSLSMTKKKMCAFR